MWYSRVSAVKVVGGHQVFIFSGEIHLHACVCVKLKCSGIKQISKGQTMRRLFIYYKLWMSSQGSLIAQPCVRAMKQKDLNEHVEIAELVLVSLQDRRPASLNSPAGGKGVIAEKPMSSVFAEHCGADPHI